MLVGAYLDTILNASVKYELGESRAELGTFLVRVGWHLRGLEDAEEGLDHVIAMDVQG